MLSPSLGTELVIIDLDFFKKVNDNYGHLAENKMLKAFVEITKIPYLFRFDYKIWWRRVYDNSFGNKYTKSKRDFKWY